MHFVRACETCYLHKFMDPDVFEEDEDDADESTETETPTTSTSQGPPAKKRRESLINI